MKKAEENWNNLNVDEKIIVAKQAAINHYKKLINIPNIKSIGYGKREKNNEIVDEICIKLSVLYKRISAKRVGNAPLKINTYWKRIGTSKRKLYSVPTDISLIKTVRFQNAVGGSSTVTRFGRRGERGTCCCYVQFSNDDPNNFYILGCAHSFAMMRRYYTPNHLIFKDYHTYYANRTLNNETYLGGLQMVAYFPEVDAAVIFVDNLDILSIGYGDNNFSFVGAWIWDQFPEFYYIHTKDGAIPCKWIENTINLPSMRYHSKEQNPRDVVFQDIPKSLPLDSKYWTEGGDSGSPVVSEEGLLLGMHFAGDGKYSYTMPISRIFNAFGSKYPMYLYF